MLRPLLVLALSVVAAVPAAAQTECFTELPAPELAIEALTIEDDGVLVEFDVPNWDVFPEELFESRDELPTCSGSSSSGGQRTFVDIYAADGERLYGFCALSSPEQLQRMWVKVPSCSDVADGLYITLRDRVCPDVEWMSNLATPLCATPVERSTWADLKETF